MRIPFIGLSGHGRGRHPPIGSQRADDPTKRKRLIEDIVGIDLPVQNEIDQFGQAKSLWCTLQKVGPAGLEPATSGYEPEGPALKASPPLPRTTDCPGQPAR